jgi:lactaldehyde reductase
VYNRCADSENVRQLLIAGVCKKVYRRVIQMADRIVLNTVSYHGSGAIKEIVGIAQNKGFKHVFVASDPDLIKFGVTAKVTDLLDEAGIPYTVYSNIKPNPTIENVQSGVKAFKECGADSIITIGGGSSMDTAKAIGIIITNPEFEDVRSLEGVAPTKNHAVPTIAVPTTAGTAAEVTINYVITDVEKKRKFVCVDTNDIPEVAIVDPDMMSSMPKGLTASTGMDALTHAIEGYTTRGAWELTDMFHLEAIKLIGANLRDAVENKPEGRKGMAMAQYIAGMGFSNVGLGIDHAMAHTLSAYYDTPHGVACAMFLPISMEFNRDFTGEKYREIARVLGVKGVDEMSQEEYRDAAINAVKQLSKDVGIPEKNEKIKEEDLDQLATDALADACYPGNPREATKEQVIEMFRMLM